MELKLHRLFKNNTYSIGKLYIDDVYFCDTLEDTDRGIKSTMTIDEIAKLKQKSITAIPTGRYKITLSIQSPKFKSYAQYAFCNGYLPRLINVPGFEGVLIHIGNKPEDTDGCILVGKNKAKGQVLESTTTFKELYNKLKQSTEDIYITID